MSGSGIINIIFSIFFVLIGAFMAIIGLGMLGGPPKNETEWTIAIFSMLAAAFLFYGAWQTLKNHLARQRAERAEAARLSQTFNAAKPSKQTQVAENESIVHPQILARWLYPRAQWQVVLKKLAEKTRNEELYTAFWFPVFFALIFWSKFLIGILLGLAFGALYVWFRTNYVKRNFAMKPGAESAEIIISDSYIRVNGNFIHYADDKYFVKNISKVEDLKLGPLLLFEIGWFTSKGLPAQLDLYVPIPENNRDEADAVLAAFKVAKR